MATGKTNTTGAASLEAAARLNNEEVTQKEKQRTSLAEQYKAEPKVTVVGAPMYCAYFGNSMPIVLNGISISVPLNGQRYEIPESFACVFNARINSVNEEIEFQKQRSNVTANKEAYPGELDLIHSV
jgi:hypothetical protein